MQRILLTVAALLVAFGCSGGGCSALTPLTQAFAPSQRVANAAQVRVSSTGIEAYEAEPSVVVAQLLGGDLALDFVPTCGAANPTCCPGGTPVTPCGPLVFDAEPQAGDAPRVALSPVQGASRIDVTLRARIATAAPVPINIPVAGDCTLQVDSAPGPTQDIRIDLPLIFQQDAAAGTTRLVIGNLSISDLTDEDVTIGGGFACQNAALSVSFFIGTLTDTFNEQLRSTIASTLCKTCPSGAVAECGAFADACTDQVCMIGAECQQELGMLGALTSGALFGGAPPGGNGSLDVHEIAGGYATTDSGGVALGVLGGLRPSGAPRDRCGPAATPPVAAVVPQSAYFQGNTRPDTATPFDVAIGVHVSQLEQLAYAAYEGGVLCPTLDSTSLPALSSAALDTAIPSLANLTAGDRPVAVGLRPQAPPSFVLGANTFDGSGAVGDPLVDFTFSAMQLDLFANVEDQPIRVLTLSGDVRVPLGVRIDTDGTLQAVLGGEAGIDNVAVVSSEPLQESATDLEALAPVLVDAALPELVSRLDLAHLPAFAGMQLAFSSVTPVDGQTFIGLFAELKPPASALASVTTNAERPRTLVARPSTNVLSLLLVAMVMLMLAASARRRAGRWAFAAAAGCLVMVMPIACGDDDASRGHDSDAGDAAVGDGGSAIEGDGGGRDRDAGGASGRGGAGSGGSEADAGIDGGQAGGGPDEPPCGAVECLPGDVDHGDLGQWSSVDTGSRTVIAGYDAVLGDLVLVELAAGDQTWRVIDGVPDEVPTHEPDGYRGGVEQAGPDVGAWSSVRLDGARVAVAYQDRDRGVLRAAFEDGQGVFHPHDVDDSTSAGVAIGAYASLALGDVPSIAYVATGVPGSGGTHRTELRLATASKKTPSAKGDWSTTVVASAVGEPPDLLDLPGGPGLFVSLLVLDDGRRVLVHYDHTQRALVAHVEDGAGSQSFDETVLDGGGSEDRGRWVSAVVDGDGLVHVGYEDSIGHQVFYLSFTPGGSVSAPELVDDGTRAGDRPHWVGAGLALWLDGSLPRIAYQDAATADVVVATKDGSWSHEDVATGDALEGFHLAAPPQGSGPLVWDRMSSAAAGSHRLVVLEDP